MTSFRGRPVLVTGAGGFIGSQLTERLVREGAQARAFVRYNSRGDQGALDWLPTEILDQVEVVRGDLRDPESVARATAGMEVAFHLGAQIAVPYSYVNPRDFIETTSEPAPGSDIARAPTCSPEISFGRYLRFCSAVPLRLI